MADDKVVDDKQTKTDATETDPIETESIETDPKETDPIETDAGDQPVEEREVDKLKHNLLSPSHWIRLVFMVLFALILQVASLVIGVVVVVQFLFALITGKDNANLREFGASLTRYIAQTLGFLTYNSEDKPFPFSDWPGKD